MGNKMVINNARHGVKRSANYATYITLPSVLQLSLLYIVLKRCHVASEKGTLSMSTTGRVMYFFCNFGACLCAGFSNFLFF